MCVHVYYIVTTLSSTRSQEESSGAEAAPLQDEGPGVWQQWDWHRLQLTGSGEAPKGGARDGNDHV